MKKNYIRMWDYRIQNTLGNIHVVDFKTSHVRTFFSTLSDEGLAHSTIKGLYGLLNPSFELAVCDGVLDVRWRSVQHRPQRSEEHSDAQITMNVYNHIADKSHVENEMSKMNLQEIVPAVV